MDTRLRVGRAVGKDENEVAMALMAQLKARGHPKAPPAIATDGRGSYREAMVETWGQVPEYSGRGRPPIHKQAQPDWHYLQVVKHRSGNRVTGITIKVVYGDPEEVRALLGEHTAYVERTHLTSVHFLGFRRSQALQGHHPVVVRHWCCQPVPTVAQTFAILERLNDSASGCAKVRGLQDLKPPR